MNSGVGSYLFVGVGTAIVIGAVTAGLMVLGSPATERERRMDQRRAGDLAEIGREVDFYRKENGKLPDRLDAVEGAKTFGLSIRDPETQQPYEYRVVDADKYQLCAQFQQDSARRGSGSSDFWRHGTGKQCFALDFHDIHR